MTAGGKTMELWRKGPVKVNRLGLLESTATLNPPKQSIQHNYLVSLNLIPQGPPIPNVSKCEVHHHLLDKSDIMKPSYVLLIWIKNGKLFQQFRGWTYRNIPQIWKHGGNHQPIARPRCISVDTFASAGEKQHLHHSKVSIMAVPIKLHQSYTWAFLNRTVTSPAKKSDIYCHHGFPQSISSIIWIQVNQILWTSWIPTPPKNRRKSAVPSKTLYLRLPGHNEFWNETCGLLQPWTKVQSRDAWRLSINTVKKLHFTVFNAFESQTCDTPMQGFCMNQLTLFFPAHVSLYALPETKSVPLEDTPCGFPTKENSPPNIDFKGVC